MIQYTVKSGDTLSKIGARYGVPWQEIARANHGRTVLIGSKVYTFQNRSPYLIWPGLVLSIPGTAPAPAPMPSPPVVGPLVVAADPVPTPQPGGAINEDWTPPPEIFRPPVDHEIIVNPILPKKDDGPPVGLILGALALGGLVLWGASGGAKSSSKKAKKPKAKG